MVKTVVVSILEKPPAALRRQCVAQLNDVLFRGLKLVVTLALLGHLFGCFWSFVSLSEEASSDDVDGAAPSTWWERVGLEREDLMGRYIASIYWAFTTMTTVG